MSDRQAYNTEQLDDANEPVSYNATKSDFYPVSSKRLKRAAYTVFLSVLSLLSVANQKVNQYFDSPLTAVSMVVRDLEELK